MLRTPTEFQCYEIIKWTIQYLQDYGMHENGLFRESKSQHDIRGLKTQLSEGKSRRQLGDLDCHVVGGVLVSALKDLPNALLFEVQDKLQETADVTDGTDECLDRIAAYLSLIPSKKLEVVRLLFPFLHHLAASPSNDANIAHLMIIFAPLFCRPANTAHMSIRHVDLLRQLRPLLQMTLDNIHYVLKHVISQPSPAPGKNVSQTGASAKDASQKRQSKSQLGDGGFNLSINVGRCNLDSSPDKKHSSRKDDLNTALPLSNLDLMGTSGEMSRHNHSASMDIDNENGSTDVNLHTHSVPPANFSPSVNTHSWEWKLLDLLVSSRVETLVHRSDLSSKWDSKFREKEAESKTKSNREVSSDVEEMTSIENVDAESVMEQDDESDEHSSGAGKQKRGRRALLAECKKIRREIQLFEEDWISKNNRHPNPHERGNMQPMYARYKDIKKMIRNDAAIDIQRLCRGYSCRRRLSSLDQTAMEMDQPQFQDVEQIGFTRSSPHLQKRPSSADAYQSHGSALAMALPGGNDAVDLSSSLPLTRSVSDDSRSSMLMSGSECQKGDNPLTLDADSKSSFSRSFSKKPAHQNNWISQDHNDTSHAENKGHDNQGKKTNVDHASSNYDLKKLFDKYIEALESKKNLKRLLKKFDDDFVLKKGRAPKKADKEVMRPQYQKYHEVRGELEKLKGEITKIVGYVPKELEDSKCPDLEQIRNHIANLSGKRPELQGSECVIPRDQCSDSKVANNNDDDGDDDDDNISGTLISSSGHQQSQLGTHSDEEYSKASMASFEELNQEKKNLHSYLKTFEKDFNRTNGRHVMHPEDILPVAKEYQRYKELKKLLKEMRMPASSS